MSTESALPTHDADFIVIGSGVAGLTIALMTARHGSTLVLTKKNRTESNSNYAQGGIAGVMGENDDEALHAADTMVAGAGLCHDDAVELLVTEGPIRIRELMEIGANFNTESAPEGQEVLALGREGGHSRNRIVHALDRTGWECERALINATKQHQSLQFLEDYFVIDLAFVGEGSDRRCVGVYALDTDSGVIHLFRAKVTILASGGCGRVYLHTTNPAVATGDGIAIAWRAGAVIANMEFIQFHPTSLYHPKGESYLISEAVRGEGGQLRTCAGASFMENYHPLGALAPRDIVARAIHAERMKHGDPCVHLDVTHLDPSYITRRFPTIYQQLLNLGIDITNQPIPVVPAAHYSCGGVQTDLHGRTSIPGLFAAGEVTCTGVHGANRLASNSLLEAMVYGHRAALAAIAEAQHAAICAPRTSVNQIGDAEVHHSTVMQTRMRLRHVMNDKVGIVRNNQQLACAESEVVSIVKHAREMIHQCQPSADLYELLNMSQVAHLIIKSAQMRKESRGLHYTTDYPLTDDINCKSDTILVNHDI